MHSSLAEADVNTLHGQDLDLQKQGQKQGQKQKTTFTTVQSWEYMSGLIVYVIKWLYGDRLLEAFEDWGVSLKEFCEGEASS